MSADTLHRFCKKEHDWGWKKFMELNKVLEGFTVSNTLVIKAQVQVIRCAVVALAGFGCSVCLLPHVARQTYHQPLPPECASPCAGATSVICPAWPSLLNVLCTCIIIGVASSSAGRGMPNEDMHGSA